MRGCVLALILAYSGGAAAAGAVADVEIAVEVDKVLLKADLLLPDRSACQKCPAIVIAQGSGSSDRNNPWTTAWANALVASGVAVIHPDKRGSGRSGGDWRDAGIEKLAEDVSAFVDHASGHPRIDVKKIGVMGFSQGGDVAPVVASINDKVRFVVSLSGSVVSLREQMLDEVIHDAREQNLSDGQLVAIRQMHAAAMAYAKAGRGYAAVAAARKVAVEQGLGGTPFVENLPAESDARTWKWLALVQDFDPLVYWKRSAAPTLFIYGAMDDNVDTGKSVDLIRRHLMTPDAPVSLVYFGENGHALFREEAVQFVSAYARAGGVDR